MVSRACWGALLLLAGCAAPVEGPLPVSDGWSGTVVDLAGAPRSGVSVALGPVTDISDEDGSFFLAGPLEGPVQIDAAPSHVESSFACASPVTAATHLPRANPPARDVSVRINVTGWSDADAVWGELVNGFVDADGEGVGRWSFARYNAALEDDTIVAMRRIEPGPWAAVLVYEGDRTGAQRAAFVPLGTSSAGDEITLDLELSDTFSGATLDGQLPGEVDEVEIQQVFMVGGTRLAMPLFFAEPDGAEMPVRLFLPDGGTAELDVGVLLNDNVACRPAVFTRRGVALAPGETLVVPDWVDPVPFAPEGGLWGTRPALTLNADLTGVTEVRFKLDDQENNLGWFARQTADCGLGMPLRYPRNVDPLVPGATPFLITELFGPDWTAQCVTEPDIAPL